MNDEHERKPWRKVKTFSFTESDELRLERLVKKAETISGTVINYSQLIRTALLVLEECSGATFKQAIEAAEQPRFGFEPKEKNPKYELTDEERQQLLRNSGLLP